MVVVVMGSNIEGELMNECRAYISDSDAHFIVQSYVDNVAIHIGGCGIDRKECTNCMMYE
jgi:hypothetical protein